MGTFLAWKADTLVMESNGDTLVLPLDSVTTIEVSMGLGFSEAHFLTGTVVGFLLGMPIGVALAAAIDPEGCRPNCQLAGVYAGALGGALLGMLIGAAIPGESWEDVSPSRLGMSFGPQRDGRFGFGASVRF